MTNWDPDETFLNQLSGVWSTSQGEKYMVTWTFSCIKTNFFPGHIVICKMHLENWMSEGYGLSTKLLNAHVIAFAEAWERLTFIRLKEKSREINFSSNGFAAGRTNKDAIAASQRELIERAIVLKAWREMEGWEKVKANNALTNIYSLIFRLKGWQLSLFQIESTLGKVLSGIAVNKDKGAVFDSVFLDSRKTAELKLLLSLIKAILISTDKVSDSLPVVARPEDHFSFYLDKKNLKAFDFLFNNTLTKKILDLGSITEIRSNLLEPLSNFPAVAQSTNKKWPEMTWGLQSIAGKNPWPHPLS